MSEETTCIIGGAGNAGQSTAGGLGATSTSRIGSLANFFNDHPFHSRDAGNHLGQFEQAIPTIGGAAEGHDSADNLHLDGLKATVTQAKGFHGLLEALGLTTVAALL